MTREESIKRLDEQAFKELEKEPISETDIILTREEYGEALEQEHYKDFCEFVAKMILSDDFEENAGANAEFLCRKLSKLGIVKTNEDEWVLAESEGDNV